MPHKEPASGSRLVVGFGREARWGEPGNEPLIYHRPVLPFAPDFTRGENPSGEVSALGWKLPGLPGPVSGAIDFAVSFTAGGSLELYEHLLRGTTKTELEAGAAYRYTFEQAVGDLAPETSFRLIYALPPVDRAQVFGAKFATITQQIGDNTPIVSRMAGQAGHGTRIGAAAADAANLGTWTGRPWVRGIMRDPSAGDIHVQVTSVAPEGIGFKLEVGDVAPTFPGVEINAVYGPEGEARWQNVIDQAGRDVGIWDRKGNRDPVEIVFPGTAADHQAINVGDTWTFKKPLGWTDPVPTYIAGQRFTSAHWFADFRAQGASAWIPLDVDGGGTANVSLGWPITRGTGNTSKYASRLDRDQDSTFTVQLPRRFRDLFFQQGLERHDRFELRLQWLGEQIGSGFEWREAVTYEFPAVAMTGAGRAISQASAVVETVDLVGEGGPSGESPVLITVDTARDWTRFADL